MKPDVTVHSVVSFMNLPLMQAFTLLPAQTVPLVSHSPTGFSFDLSCMGTGVFLSIPLCSLLSAPSIKNKSPCRPDLPWFWMHIGQTLSGNCMWTSTPVLSALGATFTKRHSTG